MKLRLLAVPALTAALTLPNVGCGPDEILPDCSKGECMEPDKPDEDLPFYCQDYDMPLEKRLSFWNDTESNLKRSESIWCNTVECNEAYNYDSKSTNLSVDYSDRIIHYKMQDGATSGFNAFATPVGRIVTYRDLIDVVKMGAIGYVSKKYSCPVAAGEDPNWSLMDQWATNIDEMVWGGPGFDGLTKPPGFDCVMDDEAKREEALHLARSGYGGGVNNHEVGHVQHDHGSLRYCLWKKGELDNNEVRRQEREADFYASNGIIKTQCPPEVYGTENCVFLPEGQLLVWGMITAWEGTPEETNGQTHPPAHIRYSEARARFYKHDEYKAGIDAFESVLFPKDQPQSFKAMNRLTRHTLEWCGNALDNMHTYTKE